MEMFIIALRKAKKCSCRLQLYVMCFVIVFTFLLMHRHDTSQLIYQQALPKNVLSQADFRRDSDTVLKLEKVNNETEQKIKLPDKPANVIENKPSQKDSNQQKQNINQQKEVKHDKPANVIENKPSQKDNNQQRANAKPDQLKVPGMNATHINGILMEPVNVNYARNIYFTIKTTYRYYTSRLFPVMLTWLQVVDKNKVSCYYNTQLYHHRAVTS